MVLSMVIYCFVTCYFTYNIHKPIIGSNMIDDNMLIISLESFFFIHYQVQALSKLCIVNFASLFTNSKRHLIQQFVIQVFSTVNK